MNNINIGILLLGSLILLLLVNYGTTKIILSMILLFIIIYFYDDIIDKIKTKEKTVTVIENNKKIKKSTYKDKDIEKILSRLKKYSKYNDTAYNNGYNHMNLFLDNIHELSKDKMKNPKLNFENAEYHLKQSLNNFQSITISVPENSYKEAIENNDFENNKYGKRISKLCKELYKYCYSLLFKLSIKNNEDWTQNPNSFKKEIIYSSDNVKPNSSFESAWDLY